MIDLHYWHTPNGQKITIFLEEAGVPYRIVPVNIGTGEQHTDAFLRISPNGRMPAIVDNAPADGGEPISVFESGAILVYLARKSGKLMPKDVRGEARVMEWLMWQMGGVGPMFGQAGHFRNYAAGIIKDREKGGDTSAYDKGLAYARERYEHEAERLCHVLDGALAQNGEYVCGELSIADAALYPWVRLAPRMGFELSAVPHVARWIERMDARPGVKKGMEIGKEHTRKAEDMDEKARSTLFGRRTK